ncbi:MAG: ribose-phosphate diphosphokinase [Spirochaetales bacterium]|nr:ribose-phosphate diphosphokinase [Spirochaetales bacterium]
MSISKPASLGILACPGGEAFAQGIIPHLRNLYSKKYDRMADLISRKYGIRKEAAIREINLASDIYSTKIQVSEPIDRYVPPGFKIPTSFTRFANGEFKMEILSSIRGMDLFIIQDVENHYPLKLNGSDEGHILSVNDHLMALFVTIDAAHQAGANSITLVLPAFPYSRQHRKKTRESLTASWFSHVCEYMGVSRIITLDIHSREIENSFRTTSLENLHGSYQVLRKLSQLIDLKSEDLVVVSPDTGAVDRNKFYSGNLQRPLAILYKERDYSRVTQSAGKSNIQTVKLLGDVRGKTVFMADDMLGTGGTLIKAIQFLKESGAGKVICGISLPLFNAGAIEHFDKAYADGLFYRIIGTNGVYHDNALLNREWYISASVSHLFARIISRLHHGRSLSALLDNRRMIQRLLSASSEG